MAVLSFACKQRDQSSSEVKGIDATPGTVSPDGKNGVIELTWPCAGNNRPNNMPDDNGNIFRGITQEEYCEWTQHSRRTPNEPLKCEFAANFDATRGMWMPQKAPASSPYRSVAGIVGMTFHGVRVPRVGREEQEEFIRRLRPQDRVRFNTQFNTFPALEALVRDCAQAGARCENVACVPDRTSDPLICRGIQTLVHTNQCQIALMDYTKADGQKIPRHPQITANPARAKELSARRLVQLYSEALLSVEWHLRQVSALGPNQRLPDSVREALESQLRKKGALGPTNTLAAAQDAMNKDRIPTDVSKEEGNRIVSAIIAHGEQFGRFKNFQADTSYKMQIRLGEGVKQFCKHAIDKSMRGKLQGPDGTYVQCVVPPGAKTPDFIPLSTCDDIADFVDIVARVQVKSCSQPLSNLVDIRSVEIKNPRPMTEVMRTFSTQNDAGAGARAGRQ
jgi:hypothetical protein